MRRTLLIVCATACGFAGGLLAGHHQSNTARSERSSWPPPSVDGDLGVDREEVLTRLRALEHRLAELAASRPTANPASIPAEATATLGPSDLESVRNGALVTIDRVIASARATVQQAQDEGERRRSSAVLLLWETTRRSIEEATSVPEIERQLEGVEPVVLR
ncbi:MAG: hypothetical protein ACT4PV_06985 [Planctomycetaceae bacterium]